MVQKCSKMGPSKNKVGASVYSAKWKGMEGTWDRKIFVFKLKEKKHPKSVKVLADP